jgi:molecular chaperone DnaK
MTYVLSIDVGTTFTAAATFRDGRAEVVSLGDHANEIPSVVFLRHDGVMLVGDAASRRAVGEPSRIAREFKRRLGDQVPILLDGERFSAEQLTGTLLAWVAAHVAERLGGEPDKIVLTCPAKWGDYRRQRLVDAAEAAGLVGAELLSEPHAAAVYYAAQERLADGALVAVYDLGGGTFDAAVLRKTEGGFELMGDPAGEDELGGVDIDEQVMGHVAEVLGSRWSALDLNDPAVLSALAQVRANAVVAKETLSSDLEAAIPVVLPGYIGEVRITRSELEQQVRPDLLRTIETLHRAIEQANVTPDQLHAVLLVGGASRMPLVSELIAAELRVPVNVDAHPKLAVCLGAAMAAAARAGLSATPVPPGPDDGPTTPPEPPSDEDTPPADEPQKRRVPAVIAGLLAAFRQAPLLTRLLIAAAAVLLLVAAVAPFTFLNDATPTVEIQPSTSTAILPTTTTRPRPTTSATTKTTATTTPPTRPTTRPTSPGPVPPTRTVPPTTEEPPKTTGDPTTSGTVTDPTPPQPTGTLAPQEPPTTRP